MKYNKKIWISEEIITDEDLNALEEGLEDTNAEVENAKVKDDGTTYPTLKDRLNDIDSQIKSLGNLESGDLENLATKDYVDQAVSNVEVDLTDYPTKEEMQQAISNVEVDLTGYATEDYVNETVSEAVSNVEVDLTDYPTREEVQDAIWASEPDLSEYATLENLNSKTALPSSSFKYASKLFPLFRDTNPRINDVFPLSSIKATFLFEITRPQMNEFTLKLQPSLYPIQP